MKNIPTGKYKNQTRKETDQTTGRDLETRKEHIRKAERTRA